MQSAMALNVVKLCYLRRMFLSMFMFFCEHLISVKFSIKFGVIGCESEIWS